MAAAKSTRLSIVEQAVADILERLSDLKPTDDKPQNAVKIRELRTKALAYERTVVGWLAHPPSEAQRSAMLKLVIELNMQVMTFAREMTGDKPSSYTGYVPKAPASTKPVRASAKPVKK